jgi:hypothetical protein
VAGDGSERSHAKNPPTHPGGEEAHLLLARALGYTWRLRGGTLVMATGQHGRVDRVRTLTLSVFQTGVRSVLRLWQRGQLVKCHWPLSMLLEAHD